MFRTITIGNNILVQGYLEREAADGRLAIRVDDEIIHGWPVNTPLNRKSCKTDERDTVTM